MSGEEGTQKPKQLDNKLPLPPIAASGEDTGATGVCRNLEFGVDVQIGLEGGGTLLRARGLREMTSWGLTRVSGGSVVSHIS